MIEKINIKAADGTYRLAGLDPPAAPGGRRRFSLTDDERQTLVRVIDLGGQYYARQNTEFTREHGNDPGRRQ